MHLHQDITMPTGTMPTRSAASAPIIMPTSSASATTPTTKTCYSCGETFPLDQFRLRKAGQERRMGNCRQCFNRSMRIYRQVRQLRHIDKFNAAIRREFDLRKVAALCKAMLSRFGGLDEFCTAWKAHLDAAPPGSRAAFDSLMAMLHLIEIADPKRPSSSVPSAAL
jgi:hypothetical protein